MLVKYFELKKKNIAANKFFLIHGSNQGLKDEIVQDYLQPALPTKKFKYDESEILKDVDNFKYNIFNKSFFENEKLIIINRVSNKIFEIIEEIILKKVDGIFLILVSEMMDKKSKLRSFFEKNNDTICIPVYEDSIQSLNNIIREFTRNKKLNISQQIINIIIERAAGDRIHIKNELEKIENFAKNKKIDINDILRITNLSENYDISELVNNCLSKNKIKIIKILNENNFSSDDCILILRTFLIKLKRLIKLHKNLQSDNQNIENIINSFKPAIFWKEKEDIKKQIKFLDYDKTKKLISEINLIELQIKKDPNSSLILTTDFVVSHTY